jgi:hypothetical protein
MFPWEFPILFTRYVQHCRWQTFCTFDIRKPKMAVGKPEVVTTLVWNKTSTRFQRLITYFRCHPIECRIKRYTARPTDAPELRWRQQNQQCVRFENESDVGLMTARDIQSGDIENMRRAVEIASISCSKPKL